MNNNNIGTSTPPKKKNRIFSPERLFSASLSNFFGNVNKPFPNVNDSNNDDDDVVTNSNTVGSGGVGSAPAISGNTDTNFLELNINKIKSICDTNSVDILDTCNLDEDRLKRFALTQTILEIYDADHDLNRSKYDKNPLVEYCKSFVEHYPKLVFINNKIVELNNFDLEYIHRDDRWKSTSQSAIKNNMENILKGLDPNFLSVFGRIPYTSSMTKEPKQLVDLQLSLKKKDIDLTIVETHRGEKPKNDSVNADNTRNVSIMLKGSASTQFDLGSNAIPLIKNENIETIFCSLTNIANNANGYNYINPEDPNGVAGPKSPLCRFFSNYFPNSFTIVIKNSELTKEKLTGIFGQMGDYFSRLKIKKKGIVDGFMSNADVAQMLESQINDKRGTGFFESVHDETYLLHMFMDSNKNEPTFSKPTFSIQKGQITADQVTEALYGVKHRCLSSKKATTPIEDSLLILDDNITAFVKFCHILYGKTIGDGIAIEIVKILAKIFQITVNLLSNDVCCTYRNVFVNGFSTRQAPSSLAGTGFGSLSTDRNVEILSMIKPKKTSLSECIRAIIIEYNQSKMNTTPNLEMIARNKKYFDMGGIDGFDNDALNDILTCAYRKIYDDEYNAAAKTKQDKIIYLIDNIEKIELEIDDDYCLLLKELCMNPQLLFIKTKVDNSFENFKNRLRNILKKIQEDYPLLIKTRVNGDVEIASTVERGISLVSSMEQLLGEVYPPDNDDQLELKKIVLYFLTVVIQKSIIPAQRIIGRYIEMLKGRLIQIIKVQATLNSKYVNHLHIESSYEELLTEFNALFNNFAPSYQNTQLELERYERRQQAKQPLNLLKFILRSIEAYNKSNDDDNYNNLYKYIKENYEKIIENPNLASPYGTQLILSLQESLSESYKSYKGPDLTNKDEITNILKEKSKLKEGIEQYILTNLNSDIIKEGEEKEEAKGDDIMKEDADSDAEAEEAEAEAEAEKIKNDVKKFAEDIAKGESWIVGSKTDSSPEDIAYIALPSNNLNTPPPKEIIRQRLYEKEDNFSVTIAPAPDAETRTTDIAKEQLDELEDTIEADDYNKLIEISSQNENPVVDTKMSGNSGGKPSRKTKNKRNKITRNKKTKNNQTKKHKRTKRRKVI